MSTKSKDAKWVSLKKDKDRIETSDTIYLTLQTQNTNQNQASSIQALINQNKDYGIKDMSEFNWYIYGLLISTRDFPIFNIYKQLQWDSSSIIPVANQAYSNYQINRTNMSISIVWAQDGSNVPETGFYPFVFDETDPDRNLLLYPIGDGDGAGNYQGMGCFLQYISNNNVDQNGNLLPNPPLYPTTVNVGTTNTQNYDQEYFNIYSMQKLMNMMNDAIVAILNCLGTDKDTLSQVEDGIYPQFTYDGTTGLISFKCDNDFFNQPNNQTVALGVPSPACLQVFFNDYLAKLLDGFNYNHFNDTDMTEDQYQGLDNALIFRGRLLNVITPSTVPQSRIQNQGFFTIDDVAGFTSGNNTAITYNSYTLPAEYPTLSNMFDAQSINIVSNSGSFNSIKQSFIPLQNQVGDDTSGSLTPLSRKVLKSLDFIFDNITETQMVNSIVQFETNQLDLPLNGVEVAELKNIYINFERVGMDNSITPLYIGVGGVAKIKICGKKIAKDII